MKERLFLPIGCALLAAVSTCQGSLINAWVNEIHYDNSGTDSGEFIEVVAPASVSDLANLVVTLYNGNDGATYGSAQQLSSFDVGSSQNGFTVYSKAISGLQNGAPDGFALSYNGTLLQFLSYEGSFTASDGVANGITSEDIGVDETSSTPIGASLGLTGTGSKYSDFSWTTFSDDTPDDFNSGQTITPTAVPEPAEWGAISAAGLMVLCGVQMWRERTRGVKASN